MKVKINSNVTFGTQPGGLYREVVFIERWSLDKSIAKLLFKYLMIVIICTLCMIGRCRSRVSCLGMVLWHSHVQALTSHQECPGNYWLVLRSV